LRRRGRSNKSWPSREWTRLSFFHPPAERRS
jgi:hypothetical protein